MQPKNINISSLNEVCQHKPEQAHNLPSGEVADGTGYSAKPHSEASMNMKQRTYYRCDKCKREFKRQKNFAWYAGQHLCWNCKPKAQVLFPYLSTQTLKQALSKTYIPRTYVRNNGSLSATFSVPSVLAGHKVKLILAG